jgi:hypothetical protein
MFDKTEMIDVTTIKVYKLSYKKVQVEYTIPIYLCSIDESLYTPLKSSLLDLRFKIYHRARNEYVLDRQQLSDKVLILQNNIDNTEKGTVVKYQYNATVSDNKRTIILDKIPSCILIKTKHYNMVAREIKLQSLMEK